jgi:hypothetical protein
MEILNHRQDTELVVLRRSKLCDTHQPSMCNNCTPLQALAFSTPSSVYNCLPLSFCPCPFSSMPQCRALTFEKAASANVGIVGRRARGSAGRANMGLHRRRPSPLPAKSPRRTTRMIARRSSCPQVSERRTQPTKHMWGSGGTMSNTPATLQC